MAGRRIREVRSTASRARCCSTASGRLISVMALEIADGQVQAVHSIINPDKLAHLGEVADFRALLKGEDGDPRGWGAPSPSLPILEVQAACRQTPPKHRRAAPSASPLSAAAYPTRPASTCSAEERGTVLYVGKAKSIRKRVAAHFSNPCNRGAGGLLDRGRALRVRRHPDRGRGAAARAELHPPTGPASTSGCATTSRTPTSRSRSTRTTRGSTSRARSTAANRAYFGPYSNAKRVRETLDLLGKVFQYRTCDGAEPGRALGQPLPRLLHQALRGALRRLRLEGGVPQVDRLDRRLPLRSLPPDRARHRAADAGGLGRPGVRAGRDVPQPPEGGAPSARAPADLERVVGTLDAIAVADGGDRRQRAGVPGPRRRARGPPELLPREPGRSARRARWPRSSCSSTTPPRRPSRRRSLVPDSVTELRGDRGGARPSAAGPPSSLRHPSGATSAGSSSSPSATPGSRSTRTGCAPSTAACSGSRRSRCCSASSEMEHAPDADRVLRHLEPRRDPHGRLDGGVRGRRRRRSRTTGGSAIRGGGAGRLRRDERGALAADGAVRRPPRALAAREGVRRELRGAAHADRDRRRQGPALVRPEGAQPFTDLASRSSAWRSGSRRCSCPGGARRS